MATHRKPDGSPFTPFMAAVLAWRKGGTGADRAYASGVVIREVLPGQTRQRVTLWLFQSLSGFDGSTLIPPPLSGPKYSQECAADEAWAPIVQKYERMIADELGESWRVEIRLSPFGHRPETVRRV
ncbi:MAG: hypothetical protein IT432_12240 [Phycisphaerales bacterium]|nr:hypothetical protein [Phycisphaerales bacterium]